MNWSRAEDGSIGNETCRYGNRGLLIHTLLINTKCRVKCLFENDHFIMKKPWLRRRPPPLCGD